MARYNPAHAALEATEATGMKVRELVGRSLITGVTAASTFLVLEAIVNSVTGRGQGSAARVMHVNGSYLVAVREPGVWYDVRDFVRPNDPEVQRVVETVGTDWWDLYRYVCRNIAYRSDVGEHWFFPHETLQGHGDCEDTSFLLTSLLIGAGSSSYAVLGEYAGWGHGWVEKDRQIMETTLTEPIVVDDPQNYRPFFFFNDVVAQELWPGALEQVMGTWRNEYAKLKFIGS